MLEEGRELDYHTLTTCYLPLTYYSPGVLEEGGELDYHTLTTCYLLLTYYSPGVLEEGGELDYHDADYLLLIYLLLTTHQACWRRGAS